MRKNIHYLTIQNWGKSFIIQLVDALIDTMLSFWMVPVFAYCLWVGKRFLKRCSGHWLSFFFLPVVFLMTALIALSLLENVSCLLFYLLGLWIGCLKGLVTTNSVTVKVDTVLQKIVAPGSWFLLSCLMILCVSKCTFDVLNTLMPERFLQLNIISFTIKGLITGLLFGQALSFWYRFWVANTSSSIELSCGRFAFFFRLEPVSHQVYRSLMSAAV